MIVPAFVMFLTSGGTGRPVQDGPAGATVTT